MIICLFFQSRVDAQELLKGLSSLLGEQGQVKGTEEAERIAR